MFAIILMLGYCIIHYACSMSASEDDRITDDEFLGTHALIFSTKGN